MDFKMDHFGDQIGLKMSPFWDHFGGPNWMQNWSKNTIFRNGRHYFWLKIGAKNGHILVSKMSQKWTHFQDISDLKMGQKWTYFGLIFSIKLDVKWSWNGHILDLFFIFKAVFDVQQEEPVKWRLHIKHFAAWATCDNLYYVGLYTS